jgi:CRP-like cAMP-binding protein
MRMYRTFYGRAGETAREIEIEGERGRGVGRERERERERESCQLILKSKTRYFSKGSIIADSGEDAKVLMVITSGQVCQFCTSSVALLDILRD